MNTIDYNNHQPNAKVKKQIKPNRKVLIDSQFIEILKQLDQPTLRLGLKLMSRIREIIPGRITYRPVSERFVESPNPYWAIQISKDSRRFCIIVFGRPNDHRPVHMIKLYKFMESYSIFHINNSNQIDEAICKISDAKKYMRNWKRLNYINQ